jgi:hypothetical protein
MCHGRGSINGLSMGPFEERVTKDWQRSFRTPCCSMASVTPYSSSTRPALSSAARSMASRVLKCKTCRHLFDILRSPRQISDGARWSKRAPHVAEHGQEGHTPYKETGRSQNVPLRLPQAVQDGGNYCHRSCNSRQPTSPREF